MNARIADILPLSYAQENLLVPVLTNVDGDDPYLIQARFRVDPPVDTGAVRDALAGLLDRHPNLRACFRHERLDEPVQVIPDQVVIPWEERDWSGCGDEELADRLSQFFAADRARRFDIARPPLVRATLVRHAAGADLLLTLHHLLLDGWSMPIAASELAALYAGRPLRPPMPYRRYLEWLSQQDRGAGMAVWRHALADLSGPTALPVGAGTHPHESTGELPAGLSAALVQRARATGVTLNTLVQAAWSLALAELSGSPDVVFGAVVAGRPPELAGMETMVGHFANTVPVRVRLRAGEAVRALLTRVQAEQLRLAGHHQVRLAELQAITGTRDLFDTILAFENFPQDEVSGMDGLRLLEIRDSTHFRLAVVVASHDRRILIRLIGHGDVDLSAVRDRLHGAFTRLAGDPEVTASVVPEGGGRAGAAAPPVTPMPSNRQVTRLAAATGGEREQRLCALFAAVLGIPHVGPEDSFFTLGGHSLLAFRLAGRIWSTMEIQVPFSVLFEAPTPAALAARLDELSTRTPDASLDPLLTLRAGSDGTALFCLHPGFGLGWSYTALLAHLPPEMPVHALQSPVLSGLAGLPGSVEQLALDYLPRIRAIQPRGPYLLLGRSFGGPLAYALATLLRRDGQEVGLLAIVDAVPTMAADVVQSIDPYELEQETLRTLLRNVTTEAAPPGRLARAQVYATVRRLHQALAGWSDERLDVLVDVCINHIRLTHAWSPSHYDGMVTLFSATGEPGGMSTEDKTARWRHTAAEVDVHELACAHSDVLDPAPAARIGAVVTAAVQRHDEYEFPVSPAQARLLVADRLHPGSAEYNVPVGFAVAGPFDMSAFGRALDGLVARHDALRTTFRTGGGGEPVQVVAAGGRAALRLESGVEPAEAGARMRAEAARPFDVTRGPLLRCTVYQLTDGSHRVLLSAHHLVCDAWSMQVMLRELAAGYGPGSYDPAPLPIQYPDFAAWQADRLAAGEYGASVAHWVERLRGAPRTFALPTDRPRGAVRSPAGGTVTFTIPVATRDLLGQVALAAGATPFMGMLATYAAFLSRLSGQDDLVIGVPVAGRDRADLQDMVGMLVNTLAVRADLSGDPSLHELIARVRDELLAGAAYQEAPFDAVVDAAVAGREPSQDPLVQVMFGFDDDTELVLPLPGTPVERVEVTVDVAKADLVLYVERRGSDLAAQLSYRRELFDHDTVAGWAENFQTLLSGLLARPRDPVSAVEILTPGQRHSILGSGDRTADAAAATGRLVPELVARHAVERPDATALVCGDTRLSYRQLLARADRIASRLREAGVGPDVRVGLVLPRVAELVVAALAVLRAGGAFVPLDPADPPGRLALLAADCGARFVLADATTADRATGVGVPVLRADDVTGNGDHRPEEFPPPHPRDLAYVIYTSGSTGAPKGVGVAHGALANLADAAWRITGVTALDRVLQVFSFTFDAAVVDLVTAWVPGAELHLAQDAERLGDALFNRLDEARISYVCMAPAVAMLLPRPGELAGLRTVCVGGEAVPPELVQRLAADGRRVINVYGPTEAAVWSTTAELRPMTPVAIGHAIPGGRTYVLDRRLRVVPVGVVGEIYVAGALLARGYIGQPAMTAERFVADPYGPAGSRMYRTGDLGRYAADGQLHCLGRADSQLKVRGFRIEPGEVESVLATHPGVSVAAVAARGDGVDRRLVAYLVSADGQRPSESELRAYLADRLPAYQVPEVFVHLDQLPVNRSGKVDRSRLPEPPAARPALAAAYTPATTGTERRVAAVWARVLGHDRIGVHDNFFELGGNSVRLLTVYAALRDSGNPDLQLIDLFRHSTVAALATHLDSRAGGPAGAADAGRRGSDRRELLAAARRHHDREETDR